MQYKLTFLGTGSAFTTEENNFQTNMLLTAEDQHLLIDCGTDIRHSLSAINLTAADIKDVYISHLHGDHCGGLEWLAFSTFFNSKLPKPLMHIHKSIVHDLWEHTLKGPMSSLGQDDTCLATYFDLDISEESFIWNEIKFELVPIKHVMKNSREPAPCYGLFLHINDKKVFITTDAKHDPDHLQKYYDRADIIFHDCETMPFKSGVHANFQELKQLDSATKQKIWLEHYNPLPQPDAKKEGFLGFVYPRQEFIF